MTTSRPNGPSARKGTPLPWSAARRTSAARGGPPLRRSPRSRPVPERQFRSPEWPGSVRCRFFSASDSGMIETSMRRLPPDGLRGGSCIPGLWLRRHEPGRCLRAPRIGSTPAAESSASSALSPQGPQPWAGAPTDGTWADPTEDDVSFGQISKPHNRRDYIYGMNASPNLTTEDGGETVTITSILRVTRVTDKFPGRPVDKDLPIYWDPGLTLPEHQMDESWGTRPDVVVRPACFARARPPSARSSSLHHRQRLPTVLDPVGQRVGTWPSQQAVH